MQRFLYFIALLLLCLPSVAQTEYDIQLFLDNVRNERPRSEELQFYLKSADILAKTGRLKEANIFYDFAASLGCVEGFRGKATTEDGPEKVRHLIFARRDTEESQRLLTSLENAKTDLASALLIHDNLPLFCLNSIRDPLLEWMPITAADSLFLRDNDQYAYMIACLKEEDGNLLDAFYLYDIAAWEGNYEALLKSKYIGANSVERELKDALIKRKKNEDPLISLHKYFAGELLSARDYHLIYSYLSDRNEQMMALSLGIYDLSKEMTNENPLSIAASSFALSINSKRKGIRRSNIIDYITDRNAAMDTKMVTIGLEEKMHTIKEDLERDSEELKETQRRLKMLSDSTNVKEGELSKIDPQMTRLEKFCTKNKNFVFSAEAVRYVKNYYKHNPTPWSDSVVRILARLKTSKRETRDIRNNIYYPLYEKGLFSSIHHTRKIIPQVIEISDE